MELTTFSGPNYVLNYNAIQLSLAMDLSLSIDESDPVVSSVEAMKEVNLYKYVTDLREEVRNVKMEFLLVCLGYNFRKYHQYRSEKLIRPSRKWELS